jgi:hypothetical protein
LRHLDRDCFVAPLLAMTILEFRHCERSEAISIRPDSTSAKSALAGCGKTLAVSLVA